MDLFDGSDGPSDGGGSVDIVALHEATRERYLNYAVSVITSRALPDVRDGLKPVQRRILYAMFKDLTLHPDGRFRKSAAIVGEVMGKYHPHGDQSIYDAMVRMAQPFSLRYPLVNGHGNFGSLDGDPPAAMRYTEAKLRELAEELLLEIRQQTVDFRPNYDGQLFEPIVLPAQVPNLLINGATGIAVGMATNIPPHNLREVAAACISLIREPDLTNADLCTQVRAPDFPTGGEILNTDEELQQIYETGQGAVKLRGTYRVDKVAGKRSIIIDSIPYALNKGTLIEKIAALILEKKVPQLLDIRDESTDDVRIVMELKRGADPEAAMAFVYKHTPLMGNFHVNMTCLAPTANPEVAAPRRMDLKSVLRYFLDFRLEVVTRRLTYQLEKLRERIHILEGFEILFDALDEAIRIIRDSEGKKDAARSLMARFALSEIQTEAILELKLYKLARLEILEIRTELEEKRAEAARIEALLADEEARWQIVHTELREVAETYGDDRRTRIVGPEAAVMEFDAEAYIVRERTWVIVSRQGRLKRQKRFSEVSAIRVPDGDEVGWVIRTDTRKTATFYTNRGSAYVLRVDDIQQTTGYGEPIQAQFNFADGERIVGVIANDPKLLPEPAEVDLEGLSEDDPRPPFGVGVASDGKALRFPLSAHAEVSTRSGRKYMSVPGTLDVVAVFPCSGAENVAIASRSGRVLLFPVHEIPPRAGAARGVNAIKLADKDTVLGFRLVTAKRDGLVTYTNRGRELIVRETSYRVTKRGGRGVEVIRLGHLERCEWPPVVMAPGQSDDDEPNGEDADDDPGASLEEDRS